MGNKSFIFRFDDVEVREGEFSFTKAGKVSTVEPKAFRALLFLLRNPQKLISKEELIQWVWGDIAVGDGSLARCIWLLRRLLGDDINEPRYIQTVTTVGYRFVCKVEVLEDTSETFESGSEPEGRDRAALINTTSAREISRMPRTLWRWLLVGTAVLAGVLVSFAWYLRRPLPPLRVTEYNQITHDGTSKVPIRSDGTRLYFNVKDPPSIGQVANSGGETAPVALAVPGIPHPLLLDVAPDGSNFLVVREIPFSDTPIWNLRMLGDAVRRLGSGLDAAFSPDGKSVAYSTQGGEIWVVRSDGSDAHKLASAGPYVFNLAWSPDGTSIRFTRASIAADQNLLWEISSNGLNLHPVLPSWKASVNKCCGRWTPDGKFFVFLVTPRGYLAGRSEIWALDEGRGLFRRPSTEPFQLMAGPIRWERPIPGRDGKIFAQGVIYRGELSRFDFRTGQFKPFLGGISAQGATFSRDGKSVAYVSYPEGALWKANADGSGAVQLTDPPMEVFSPQLSPDGTQIVFTALSLLDQNKSYVVSSEGGTPRRLVPDDKGPEVNPDWSPDGHKIVFSSRLSPERQDSAVVRIIDLDSGGVTTVPGSVGKWAPRWSPDGRYLVAGGATDLHKLMIFDFKTQQWSTLAENGSYAAAQWSHDGRYIYYRQPVDDRGVFRIPLTGGKAERVVDLRDWHDAGWFGKYLALDPTDAPLLLRDIGSKDIYALTLEEK
jgi:Tol biopolymer transport system component/DNA-binding winged helix-turn-helix (wHTH) protein